ncbi:hypothetical protein [Tengunoibacter tsumagoiensis]|uniref:Uncharacterized protein n=1 Tax=Tengunoibacter tsumagoiensis TaxID=2014871 RepID=A0A401ZW53_9CHLR|nr:hypothetical protein [Tengunoibacter tsumagoiensis]GCE11000.1 hypothetical protein KTT_08590 [Tengunoibacter tsumagoiensis]
MYEIAPEVVAIAEACLGGLQGRSALLLGPAEQFTAYTQLLHRARMKYIYQEASTERLPHLLPNVQLVLSRPDYNGQTPLLTAATIAKGCEGRHSPLLIFDLAPTTSVEELAGLLPTVCLYTPEDLRSILTKVAQKAS